MHIRRFVSAVAVGSLLAAGSVITAAPATALSCTHMATGRVCVDITWWNRSVGITGYVEDYGSPYSTQAYFTGTDGGPTESQDTWSFSTTRTASPGQYRGFNFVMDASDVRGGIRVLYVSLMHLDGTPYNDDVHVRYDRP